MLLIKKSSACCALVFVLQLLLVVPVMGQSRSTLRVIVTDEAGDALTGANVLVYDDGFNNIEQFCVTNFDGFCQVIIREQDWYRLKISFIGFQNFEERIFLEEGDVVVRRIELVEQVGELGEVLVEEERGYTTGSLGITRVEAEDLSRVPSLSLDGDLMAYIKTVPGVISLGDQGGDLYIRGGSPIQNLVLVDNIPIIKPFHISNLFSAFPEQVVSNIDILAGGFDASYMSSTSAVIDVNLKTGDLVNHKASGSFSPYISSLFYEGPIQKKKSSMLVSGRVSTIKTFSGHLSSEKKDVEFYDVLARYSLHRDGFICNFTAILTDDKGKISDLRDSYLGWSNASFGGRCFGFDEYYARPFEISIGTTSFQNSERSADGSTDNKSEVKQAFMRLDFEDYWFNQKFDYGINILAHTYRARVDSRFTFVDEARTDRFPMFQIYLRTTFDPTNNIRITPSIGTQSTIHFGPTLEPRLRVVTKPFGDNRSELSLAVGKYHQALDGFSDQRDAGTTFTIYRPNAAFAPLFSSIHRIVGLKNKIGSRIKTNIEAYYMTHNNVPIAKWTNIAQTFVLPAQANSKSYGINTRIEYETKKLYLYLGYSWSKVRYKAATDDLGAWLDTPIFEYSPPHDQRHQLSTIASINIGEFKANVTWELGSGRPFTKVFGFDFAIDVINTDPTEEPGVARTLFSEPYGSRLPYYHRLDASIERGFRISEGFSLEAQIGCLNVYDRNNVFYLDLNVLERVDQSPILPYAAIKISKL